MGRRSTPTCQSSELVEGEPEMGATTWVSGSEPVDCHKPTVLALKSMSYAKLYQVPGSSGVDHCVT